MKSSSRICSQEDRRVEEEREEERDSRSAKGLSIRRLKRCVCAFASARDRRAPASYRCDGMRLPGRAQPPHADGLISRCEFQPQRGFFSLYLTRLLRVAVWRSAGAQEPEPVQSVGIGAQRQTTGMGASALPCTPLSLSHMFKTQVALCNRCQRRVE